MKYEHMRIMTSLWKIIGEESGAGKLWPTKLGMRIVVVQWAHSLSPRLSKIHTDDVHQWDNMYANN